LPEPWLDNMRLLSACISGAADIDTLHRMLADAGFEDIGIVPKDESREFIRQWEPETSLEDYVVSAAITAKKPAR
jgi:arsenite methyltransferase